MFNWDTTLLSLDALPVEQGRSLQSCDLYTTWIIPAEHLSSSELVLPPMPTTLYSHGLLMCQ
jgi:hypothetical protein